MTRIVQICPEIGPGSGVGSVAHHLEQEWRARGIEVESFTMSEAHGDWLPEAGGGIRGKLILLSRVAWFSLAGTVFAQRRLQGRVDVVSVCHNDALTGDVYVNHGIVQTAMRARGRYWWRMLRNPLHLLTSMRDRARYAGIARHRLVVNLVPSEESALREAYPRLRVPTAVIGNGVDIERYRVPTLQERADARLGLGIGAQDLMLLFVGHEYDRKGLDHVVAALDDLPANTHLVVVGGTPDMVAHRVEAATAAGLADRVHLVGPDPDPMRFFHAADVFVLPSAYESFGLVILEALASGVPVVATATGCVPGVIVDGRNGYTARPEGSDIAQKVLLLVSKPLESRQAWARSSAELHSWSVIADRYLQVLQDQFGATFGNSR